MSPPRSDDRQQLLDLVARYAQGVDRRDLDALVDCFTPDARLMFVSTGAVLVGHDEIRQFFAEGFSGLMAPATSASTHVMTNTLVTFADSGDEAVMETTAVSYFATETRAEVGVRGLTYSDRCVRSAAGWRFQERTHALHWEASMPGGVRRQEPGPFTR